MAFNLNTGVDSSTKTHRDQHAAQHTQQPHQAQPTSHTQGTHNGTHAVSPSSNGSKVRSHAVQSGRSFKGAAHSQSPQHTSHSHQRSSAHKASHSLRAASHGDPGAAGRTYTGANAEARKHAVDEAESHTTENSRNVKMGNYHTNRQTNNCAEFVSGALANAGLFKPGADDRDASVSNFRTDLTHQGYHTVSKANAQPGDVAIMGNKHTELVSSNGGGRGVGANGKGVETVSDQSLSWAGKNIQYYHKGD